MRTCPQCEMQYSVHEPEDELLHREYHNRVKILTFKGWNNERLVTQISEWNPPGRIICVLESDSKAKKDRVKEIVAMVDRDLGFASGAELKPKTQVRFRKGISMTFQLQPVLIDDLIVRCWLLCFVPSVIGIPGHC